MRSVPRALAVIAGLALTGTLVACGDDDATASFTNPTDGSTVAGGVEDISQWCGVIKEIDDLFDATDNSSDDFVTKQPAYERIRRLTEQALASIELVDVDVRNDVSRALDAANELSGALASAADEAEAEDALTELFTNPVDPFVPAAAWIEDTCGVSISS